MHFVIIGGGIAGITAARMIAAGGVAGSRIDVYTNEPYLYYPRPRLPDFLAGEISLQDLILYPRQWYEQRGIQMHLSTEVRQIRPADHELVLEDGTKVDYDRLLLANGSRPNVPPFGGTDKTGVFTLRSLSDAMAICDYARHAEQAVVIGGGLLGLEAARGLHKLGVRVTVVEFFERLLPRQLDAIGADVLQKQIEAMGISVATNAHTEEIEGNESVSGVRMKDGRRFPCQMVLISAGIRPNIELAQAAGIAVKRGVVVDEHIRTSVPDIWAAGDVAEFEGRTWGIVAAATEQARVAAANMIDDNNGARYVDIVPSNTLKVVGVDLTSIGVVNPEGDGFIELRRHDVEAGCYQKLVIHKGIIVGAILLGQKDKVRVIGELISRKVNVSAHVHELLQDDFDLHSLLARQ